jgi:hypothetical protein
MSHVELNPKEKSKMSKSVSNGNLKFGIVAALAAALLIATTACTTTCAKPDRREWISVAPEGRCFGKGCR